MSTDSRESTDTLIEKLQTEIVSLLRKGIPHSSVFFRNASLVKCWEAMDCTASHCELHGKESDTSRCWQITCIHCDGEIQGDIARKHGKCKNCGVFKDSSPTIVEVIGEYINNMLFLLNQQKRTISQHENHIDVLNKEITHMTEQLESKQREIQEVMITDKLTGLFNRQHIMTFLEDEIARCNRYGHSLAVMLIHIDDFKNFNASFGHQAGDSMLLFAGRLIRENIRKFDRAFRYTGKEFMIVLPETDSTLAYIVAERMRKRFEQNKFAVTRKANKSEEKASCTLSIGFTSTFSYTLDSVSVEELLDQTELALTRARERGGNLSLKHE